LFGLPGMAKGAWRRHNTALGELKLLRQIMAEAVTRELAFSNPVEKLGIKKAPTKEKRAWTDEELTRVDAALKASDPFGWMRCAFLLGRYQAARLRSCALPLDHIDLKRRAIHYAAPKGGREKAFTQPIDKRLLPDLKAIVAHRRSIGATTLCDLPQFPSLELRRYLDGLGITGVSQHDLRRTWITRAALAGIPESVAMAFTNHASTEVHRIYMAFPQADIAVQLDRLG
jgi:integrase